MAQSTADVLKAVTRQEYRIPSITAYNRLEASPRTADFSRSLRAEVRDPLWLLTCQWQFGEFQGEDAASPVTARILGEHTTLVRISMPGALSAPYDVRLPLEVQIEREKPARNLFLATRMARVFQRLMRDFGLTAYLDRLLVKYKLDFAIDRNDYEGLQLLNAAQGRLIDGALLYGDIVTPVGAGTRFEQWMDDEGITGPDRQQFALLAEFGLIYSNDWFMLPYPMEINTLCEMQGMTVTDVFGQPPGYAPPAEEAKATGSAG